jgi:hypothetical protein
VRNYASDILLRQISNTRCEADAEPYLKEALASGDKNTVHTALFVVGVCNCSGLKQEVRAIVWSDKATEEIQFMATLTLDCLEDAEGLRNIARKHPTEKIRGFAKDSLRRLEEKK